MASDGKPVQVGGVPWCTLFLIIGTVVFHTLTLVGNLNMATAINNIGTSVGGWSLAGLGLSGSFGNELNNEVESVQTGMTEAIVMIDKAMADMDSVLELFGVHIDIEANKSVSLLMQEEHLRSDPLGAILGAIMSVIGDIPKVLELNGLLKKFLNKITPSLEVIGKWILKFGPKIQTYISQFGTTIDRAQKTIDKILMKLMGSNGFDNMVFQTFNLYDMEHKGYLVLADIHIIGASYAIDAYQGAAGTKLFKKYAGNNSIIEKGPEFHAFVSDTTVPFGMATLLRAYAKIMSQIGGQVKHSIKRTDMSSAVAQYLTLTCARNLTKVTWVTQMLTNATLPLPFTACVLIELADMKNDPNKLTTVDTGAMAVGAMLVNNMTSVMAAIDLLHNPKFFVTQGFDVSSQPTVLKTLTHWVTIGPSLWEKMISTVVMLEVAESSSKPSVPLLRVLEEMPNTARRLSEENVKKFKVERSIKQIAERRAKFKTKTQETLLLHLTGGRAFTDMIQVESAAQQVVNGGVPCAPVTLEWAQWLAFNASRTAKELYGFSMDYAKGSSSTTDSFNTQIQGILKKVSSFIGVMEQYSTPQGIASLKQKIENFGSSAIHDVLGVVENTILGFVKNMLGNILGGHSSNHSAFLELESFEGGNRSAFKSKAGTQERARHILSRIKQQQENKKAENTELTELSQVWKDVQTMLSELYNLMPSAVNTITTAKGDVQQVYMTLETMFKMLHVKAPVVLSTASGLYRLVWVLYFCFIIPFTISILFYAFYAYGWCGGPQGADTTEYEAPQTCWEHMQCCYRCCCSCCSATCDSSLCFWSFIILMQIIALLMFLLSVVFVIIGGIGILLAFGCSEIYLINDDHICQTTMSFLQDFLSSFNVGAVSGLNPLTMACGNHNLLLCKMIASDMISAAKFTMIGSFLATIFTFQLIFDSAMVHEKVRWMRQLAEMQKDV